MKRTNDSSGGTNERSRRMNQRTNETIESDGTNGGLKFVERINGITERTVEVGGASERSRGANEWSHRTESRV